MPNCNCPYGAVASGLTAQQTGSRNNTVGILNAASLGGEIGKRAVENNYLSSLDVEHFIQELEKAQKEGRDTKPIIEKYQKISAENRQELLACNGNVLCESGHLYQMNAGAEEVERNLGFFSRMTVPYPNNLNENNRILLSTLVEQENANSFNQLSSGTKFGLSAIELGAAIGGTGLITKDSLGKFKLSNANANSKLPVVGKTENYENQTSKIHISSGAENNALPPNLKYQQEATRYINNSVNGFYDSKEYRELLTRKYGENVKSTTVPPSNAKNVNLAGKIHPITGVPFDNKGFPIFDKYAAYDTRLDISSFRNKSYTKQMGMATKDLANSIKKGYINENNFTSEQLNAIYRGEKKIPGFTWHHHQDTGRMQLIPERIHQETGHIGGRSIQKGK
ncbi:HNH endonuclease [Avibacterium paragallinarum]|uniref:HNH endonuclease n=1 Tax=Avibacterium paragallinarum TaxID=728 RepID=UPI00397B8DCD